jgi:integrase
MTISRLKPLTVKEIEKLAANPPNCIKHRYLGGVPGFVLVHTPAGYTGYGLIYRAGGKRKKLTLGSTKRMTLADARALAGKQRSRIEAGEDPHDEKLEAKRKEKELIQQQAEVQHLDVELMWEKYMKIVASQLRSRDEKDRVFRRYILPTVKGRCVNEITKTHALKIFDDLVGQDKRRMADKVRQEGAAFFQWLLEREHVERNVFAGIRKANARKTIRTRVLSDAELGEIWRQSEVEGRWSLWFKLLILTGCRNMEVRAARWSEFDIEKRLWTIPTERAKNGHPHSIYLTDAMIGLLEQIPRFKDCDLLFPAARNSRNPMSGDQKIKDRIDARVRKALSESGAPALANWCVHDFRRTIATGLQRLGFRPDIADQVIGHVGSTRSGAAAHYLHHRYEEEKKQAFEAWSKHVEAICSLETGAIAHVAENEIGIRQS